MDTFLEIQADLTEEVPTGDAVYVMQMILREIGRGKPRLAQHADAHLLKSGEAFLLAVMDSAAADDYSVFCRSSLQNPDPRRLSRQEIHTHMSSLVAGTPDYPIVFWLLPAQSAAGETAIHDWFDDPESRILLHTAIRAGGIWISIADVFLDVLTSAVQAPLLLDWLRSAEMSSPLPIRWTD
jgi:hypothetical protein